MAKNRVIVLSIIESGLRPAEAARRYGVSRRWVEILLVRYRTGGLDALDPGSRAPHHRPHATPPDVVERIVQLRHELSTTGQDVGAVTISMRLEREGLPSPSRATIHRILRAHDLVTPQPRKRPRSSWHRFEADQPNEMWQADFTHWPLADDTDVEILDFLDDHSRFLLTARPFTPVTGPLVTATFMDLTRTYGAPAAMLTDNGMVFTTRFAQGRRTLKTLNSFERALQDLGVRQLNGAPNHPQTQGKIDEAPWVSFRVSARRIGTCP
uniref:DDE-type integrase/transposase/recombinase n=1 Tax=Brachybacterium sp. FME24 TaxID=2742605 RepID=UPI00186931D5